MRAMRRSSAHSAKWARTMITARQKERSEIQMRKGGRVYRRTSSSSVWVSSGTTAEGEVSSRFSELAPAKAHLQRCRSERLHQR